MVDHPHRHKYDVLVRAGAEEVGGVGGEKYLGLD
jgi:hypothetical protein